MLVFSCAPPLGWTLEPYLRRRLPGEVHQELRRAKEYLEAAAAVE